MREKTRRAGKDGKDSNNLKTIVLYILLQLLRLCVHINTYSYCMYMHVRSREQEEKALKN